MKRKTASAAFFFIVLLFYCSPSVWARPQQTSLISPYSSYINIITYILLKIKGGGICQFIFNTQYHAKQILLNIALVDYFRDFNQTQTNSHMRAYRYEKQGSRVKRAFAIVRGPRFRENTRFNQPDKLGHINVGSRVQVWETESRRALTIRKKC